MSFDVEKLYSLLPAVHRIRDIERAGQLESLLDQGEQAELESLRSLSTLTAKQQKRLLELEEKRQRGPLKALLSIIAEQAAVLEENLDQLYDDLFIETCAEWVVPYIGDLIGARGVFVFPGATFTERAFVANTLAYRRRKGTAAVLEQLARDVTDWPASVVEYFQLLATTQYMNHIRLDNLSIADLRNSKTLEALNTPFDRVTRTADVRRIEPRRGKYNIPNIGIFLYRIGSFPITEAPAFELDAHRWLFDALGKDTQLFNKPEPEDEITHLAEPINVPVPLTRRSVDREKSSFYGVDQSFSLIVDDQAVTADQISYATSDWARGHILRRTTRSRLIRSWAARLPLCAASPSSVMSVRMASAPPAGTVSVKLHSWAMKTRSCPRRVDIQQALGLAADGGVVEIRATTISSEALTIAAGPMRARRSSCALTKITVRC
jgi:hypothetical protein